MDVLLITESYPPILNSAARLFSELAGDLRKRNYRVSVLTEVPNRYLATEIYEIKRKEFHNGVKVIRLPSFILLRRILSLRYIEQFIKMLEFFVAGFFEKKDVIIVYSPPLPLAISGILLAKFSKSRVIINIQDIYPDTPISLGIMRNHFLINVSKRIEKWVYRNADFITVHSEGNKKYILNKGVNSEEVVVVPNWVDLERYSPDNKGNSFRERYNLQNKFIVSYAGVMGFAQGVEEIIDAAKLLSKYKDIFFVLAGGGSASVYLKDKARKKELKNVLFLPHLLEEGYIELLKTSDICLVTLHKELKTPVVPGKLQCIMAVGKPVICSVPSTSDAKSIVENADCGVWIEPGNARKLKDAVLLLYKNVSLKEMGERGRKYAEDFFDREKCIDIYEGILR